MAVPAVSSPAVLDPVPRRVRAKIRALGVALPMEATPHAETLIAALDRATYEAGVRLLVADTGNHVVGERDAVRALREGHIDGLLLTPAPGDDAVVNQLLRLAVPTVLVDRMASRSDVDQVGVENIQSASAVVRHLAARGHRRIGLVTGPAGVYSSDERVLGYRLGLGRAGLPYERRLVAGGGDTPAGTARAIGRLLQLERPPSAVLVAGDAMLLGAQYEAHRRGVRIGTELALVGYGDAEWARAVRPALTTMALPIEEVARHAVHLLLARIAEPERRPRSFRVPPVLMHRGSCGCS